MSYSQVLPIVLQRLQQRQDTRMQSPVAQIGQSLLTSSTPQFESPWATIAARFAQSLIGGGMAGYAQDQAQTQNQAEQQAVYDALQTEDPTAALNQAGLPEVASSFGLADLVAKREQEMMLSDPAFIRQGEQRAEDVAFRDKQFAQQQLESNRSYGIQSATLAATLQNRALEAKLAQQDMQVKALLETGKITREGAREVNDLTLQVSKDPTVAISQDMTNRATEMAAILKIEDPKERQAASSRYATVFSKLPNEAYMSDDAKRFADSLGVGGRWESIVQSFTGGGTVPQDMWVPMYRVTKLLAETYQTRKNQHLAQIYAPRVQAIIDTYKNPLAPNEALVSSAPFDAFSKVQTFEDINGLPTAPTVEGAPKKEARSFSGVGSALANTVSNWMGY